MSRPSNFIHLRSHSAYSLLEGAIQLKDLLKLVEKQKMPAIGLTDSGNLFGALEFSEKAKGMGIQPIIGCQLLLSWESESKDPNAHLNTNKHDDFANIVLLAMDDDGYANLVKLVSRSFMETGSDQRAHISFDLLRELSDGLICLSGGLDGPLDLAILDNKANIAEQKALGMKDLFGDRFYIELQRMALEGEDKREAKLLDIAYNHGIPIVATNEPFFEKKEDYDAHDALICISQGAVVSMDDRRRLSDSCYFKSSDEMVALFSDLPEAIDNTYEIAQRCHVRALMRDPILPLFAAEGLQGDEAVAAEAKVLRDQAIEGLKARLDFHGLAPDRTEEEYFDRINFELDVIENMKFPGYFLIVADFIKWAKSKGIPVGPGRGSGAGSVVAWALTITDLDPLRFSLLFERFLNPERISMPDFDLSLIPI